MVEVEYFVCDIGRIIIVKKHQYKYIEHLQSISTFKADVCPADFPILELIVLYYHLLRSTHIEVYVPTHKHR